MKIKNKLFLIKFNKNYVLILIILFVFIFALNRNVLGNNFKYSFDIEANSNVFFLYDLYNKKLFNPEIITAENINLDWEHRYDFNMNLNFNKLPQLYFGYFKKYEVELKSNEELIHFLYDIKHNHISDNNYMVKLEFWSQLLDGIYLGTELYQNTDYGISVDFYGKLLRGLNLERSYYNGQVYSENGDIKLKALRNSIYSFIGEDTNLYDVDFYSQGYSFDCNIFWEINDKNTLSLAIKDLYSRLYWYDVYTKVGKYDTDNIVEENEHFKYVPTFQGRFYYDDYQTNLTPDIDISYRRPRLEMGVNYQYKLNPYFSMEVIKKEMYDKQLSIYLGLYGEHYTGRIKYSAIEVELMVDELDFISSRSVMGKIAVGFEF